MRTLSATYLILQEPLFDNFRDEQIADDKDRKGADPARLKEEQCRNSRGQGQDVDQQLARPVVTTLEISETLLQVFDGRLFRLDALGHPLRNLPHQNIGRLCHRGIGRLGGKPPSFHPSWWSFVKVRFKRLEAAMAKAGIGDAAVMTPNRRRRFASSRERQGRL
jgi:hypothetical protein